MLESSSHPGPNGPLSPERRQEPGTALRHRVPVPYSVLVRCTGRAGCTQEPVGSPGHRRPCYPRRVPTVYMAREVSLPAGVQTRQPVHGRQVPALSGRVSRLSLWFPTRLWFLVFSCVSNLLYGLAHLGPAAGPSAIGPAPLDVESRPGKISSPLKRD